jgi:hypothetical protein
MPTDPSTGDDIEPTANPGTDATNADHTDYKVLYNDAQKESASWRSRFTGLQGKYQQEQEKWADDVGKLTDIQGQLDEVSGIREQLDIQVKTLGEQLTTAQSESEINKGELERVTVVTSEFPQLVPFLKDGLIPDAAGDELRTKLKSMSERIDEIKTVEEDEHVAGATLDDQPPAAGKKGPTALLTQAIDAMKKGDTEAYNDLYSQYLEETTKQGGQ